MKNRFGDYDITCRIKVTDPKPVNQEVRRIFTRRYPASHYKPVERAFHVVGRLFRGEYPGYVACETPYHNLQHTLDMTLATARLLDGHERSYKGSQRLGPKRFAMGLITALFHDSGYIRSKYDSRHAHGAEYTATHITRGERWLTRFLPRVGMKDYVEIASDLVHFTGYEKHVDELILTNPKDRLIGCAIATADLLAQMSDRCYLEKCRDFLYQEFVIAGMTRKRNADGSEEVIYASAEDLLLKSPEFISTVRKRLDTQLGGVYRYLEKHFGGRNPYLEEMDNNLRYLSKLVAQKKLRAGLRRAPPRFPGSAAA